MVLAAETLCSTGRQQSTISAAARGGRSRKLSSATVHPSTALSLSEETQYRQEHPEPVHSNPNAAAVCCKATNIPVHTINQTFSFSLKKKRSAENLCELPVNLSRYRQHHCYNWTHNKAAWKKRYLFWQHMVQLLCPTLLHSVEMTCKKQHLF